MIRRRVVPVLLLAGALSACQDDGGSGELAEPAPPASTTATTDPTGPDATTTPGEPAATGPRLERDVVSLRIPAGWTREKDFFSEIQVSGAGPAGEGLVSLTSLPDLSQGRDGTSQLARYALRNYADTAEGIVRRLDDVEVGGVAMAHLRGRYFGNHIELFTAAHRGRVVTLDFSLKPDLTDAADRGRIVDSVLASVAWT